MKRKKIFFQNMNIKIKANHFINNKLKLNLELRSSNCSVEFELFRSAFYNLCTDLYFEWITIKFVLHVTKNWIKINIRKMGRYLGIVTKKEGKNT